MEKPARTGEAIKMNEINPVEEILRKLIQERPYYDLPRVDATPIEEVD